jgi:hypothetical protein
MVGLGVQTSERQTQSLQVLIHGIGVLGLVWMLTDTWAYVWLAILGVFTVLVPWVLEIVMIVNQRAQF